MACSLFVPITYLTLPRSKAAAGIFFRQHLQIVNSCENFRLGNAVEKLADAGMRTRTHFRRRADRDDVPLSINTMRSAIRNALANSCVTTTIVMVKGFFQVQDQLIHACSDDRVQPRRRLVEKKNLRIHAMARATAARFFIPPLSCEGM